VLAQYDGQIEVEDFSSRLHSSRILQGSGIDKLALWFQTVPPHATFDRQVPFKRANLRITARGTRAGVEFNPSRIVDPDGVGIASVQEMLQVANAVWSVVAEHAAPLESLASASVTRLDVARDFSGSTEPSRFILGMARLQRAYGGDPTIYYDRTTGEAKSLSVGSRDQRMRLYRKDLESPRLAPFGFLRWEHQLRSKPLRRFGISVFDDLTPWAVRRVVEDRWRWGKMTTCVSGKRDVLRVIEALDESRSIKARLYYDLQRLATYGVWPTEYRSRKELSDLITRIGIVVDVGNTDAPEEPTMSERLDWLTGTVITTMEA